MFNFKWLNTGFCKHPEFMTIQGGNLTSVEYPSFFGLLVHPVHGVILYDTGYSTRFKEETKRMPEKLYSMVTPVCCNSSDTAKEQLKKYGLEASDVNYIIISHFHADHICGLSDFPNAKFIYNKKEYDYLINKNKISQIYNGFLNNLLPSDFLERSIILEELKSTTTPSEIKGFDQVFDLFKDNSLLIVSLPGHSKGQIGLLFTDNKNNRIFLIGDAVWDTRTITENRLPFVIAQKHMDDPKKYLETIKILQSLNTNELLLIPSHCKSNKGRFE